MDQLVPEDLAARDDVADHGRVDGEAVGHDRSTRVGHHRERHGGGVLDRHRAHPVDRGHVGDAVGHELAGPPRQVAAHDPGRLGEVAHHVGAVLGGVLVEHREDATGAAYVDVGEVPRRRRPAGQRVDLGVAVVDEERLVTAADEGPHHPLGHRPPVEAAQAHREVDRELEVALAGDPRHDVLVAELVGHVGHRQLRQVVEPARLRGGEAELVGVDGRQERLPVTGDERALAGLDDLERGVAQGLVHPGRCPAAVRQVAGRGAVVGGWLRLAGQQRHQQEAAQPGPGHAHAASLGAGGDMRGGFAHGGPVRLAGHDPAARLPRPRRDHAHAAGRDRGHDPAPDRRGQRELAARLGARGATDRGGVARDDRGRHRRPAGRRGLHLRRHRVRQPRAQGHLLGAP